MYRSDTDAHNHVSNHVGPTGKNHVCDLSNITYVQYTPCFSQ